MDCNFGYFEDMTSYEAWKELNTYHDIVDSMVERYSFDDINEILSRLADEQIVESLEVTT
jgi:hypothetical protein